jgi:hypothetical protein
VLLDRPQVLDRASQSFFASTRCAVTSIATAGKPMPRLSTASAALMRTTPGNLALCIIFTRVSSASWLKLRASLHTSFAVGTANIAARPTRTAPVPDLKNSLMSRVSTRPHFTPIKCRFPHRERAAT